MALKIQLRSRVADPEKLRGKVLTERDVSVLLEGDVDVYKPDGSVLCMLRRGAIPAALSEAAYPALYELRKNTTNNRGAYAGAKRMPRSLPDGSLTKTTRTLNAEGHSYSVASATVGYYDRQGGHFPFCRETAFTANQVGLWKTIVPMVEHVAGLMRTEAPKQYAVQAAECAKCPPEFVIAGTPFTTLTVNNNVAPAAVHTDRGDFKSGIGVISVVRRGSYEGGWLVFPEYRAGVDLRDGDVLFFNSHEWHGVTAMRNTDADARRISVVYYMRAKMVNCLSPEKEMERVLKRNEVDDVC